MPYQAHHLRERGGARPCQIRRSVTRLDVAVPYRTVASPGEEVRNELVEVVGALDRHYVRGTLSSPMAQATSAKDVGYYVARRTAEGKSKREIIRCLKRYVAREIYRALTEVHASGSSAA